MIETNETYPWSFMTHIFRNSIALCQTSQNKILRNIIFDETLEISIVY
jgi:hypothetical protein